MVLKLLYSCNDPILKIITKISNMGDQQSKPETQGDDFYLLQHISKMSLKNLKIVSYYLISTTTSASVKTLRQYFKIDTFPSVGTLKQEMSFVGRDQVVKVIITESVSPQDIQYLQSEAKVRQVVGLNSQAKGGKIAGNAKSTQELIALLNNLEEQDQLEISTNNVLFTIDQDTKKLNLYRLNYHCNTMFEDRIKAKEDFVKLSRKLYPSQNGEIDRFQKEYKIDLKGEQKRRMVLSWVFANNFYWDLVNQLTRNTNDPKRLAYLRLPIKDMHQTILQEYRAKKFNSEFFLIVEMTQTQKQKLQKSQKNFMLFTSFMKGYNNQKQALGQWKELKKTGKHVMLTVNIDKRQRPQQLDFGLVQYNNQILVNIYNVFGVDKVTKRSTAEVLYGVLPMKDKMRQDQQFRLGMTKQDLDLTRNYDFLQDLMKKVDGQATLLQINGYYKDSLEVYDRKVDFIRKTNQSQQVMNRTLIKKADALALTGDHFQAQKAYRQVTTSQKKIKVISLIHLADMYMRLNQQQKLEDTINEIQPLLFVIEKDEKQREEFYKGKHLMALKSLKKGNYKNAKTMLTGLITDVSSTYKYTLEGKPLYHDIYRSLAACQFKQGFPNDALAKLNTTLELQLACQGKTQNVAMTQTLIQTVCRTSGNQQELQKSEGRLKEMSTEFSSNESKMLPASITPLNSSVINVNSSMVKIDT